MRETIEVFSKVPDDHKAVVMLILGILAFAILRSAMYHFVVLFQGWPKSSPTDEDRIECEHQDSKVGLCVKAGGNCRTVQECDLTIATIGTPEVKQDIPLPFQK